MEAVELTQRPSLTRRRLSRSYLPGAAGSGRGSLIALEHPSVCVDGGPTGPGLGPPQDAAAEDVGPPPRKRVSVPSRRASAMSRFFALNATSEAFREEMLRPTLVSAMIFLDDPSPDVEGLRRTLAERLLDIPRFRCVVRDDGKGGIVFDPLARSDVRVNEHIEYLDGKNSFGPGDIEELITDAYLSDWGVDMPLWRMKIVTNLKDGRSLLFVAIDHALGDGVGMLSVFLSLFDDAEEEAGNRAKRAPTQKTRRQPRGLSLSHRTVAFLKGVYVGIVHSLIPPPSDLPHSLMVPKERLKEPCPGKDFAQTRAFPLDEVRAMKGKLDGATVNDVIMAILSMAIRRYLERKGDADALARVRSGKGTIRAQFPVNMRRGEEDDKADLGNNITFGAFPLPFDYEDPVDCVWRVKARVDELKASPAFAISKGISDAVLPGVPAEAIAGMMMDSMNRTTCMISNVVGPARTASLGGYAIDDLNFTTAFSGNLYLGVLSFGGRMRVSGLLDQKTGGNMKELIGCVEESYDALGASLEGVDSNAPIGRPDATPRSAKVLEFLVVVSVIALPVMVASKFFA